MADEIDVLDALARLCTGKQESDVLAVLKACEVPHRVMRRDGKAGVGTRDLRRDRFNLTITDGVVTEVRRG